jgi:hypothetical protein
MVDIRRKMAVRALVADFTERIELQLWEPPTMQNRQLPQCRVSQSQSHIETDGQSVSLSWCRAPSGAHDQILVTVLSLGGRPL